MGWRGIRLLTTTAVAVVLTAAHGEASHDWGGYHWPRSANPFLLRLGDNVSSTWDAHLATAASDWGQSTVINTTIYAGLTRPKPCKATLGRVEVCSERYGNNGWLGLAQIWISGTHIQQGIVKVNDYYFSRSPYNTSAYRNYVMCQEVGHTLGLDHVDENPYNTNKGTCMDYTNNPSTNQHPNQHDYDMLVTKYTHLDGAALVADALVADEGPGRRPAWVEEWGELVHEGPGGATARYERDLGGGRKLITVVHWAVR